MSRHLGWRVLLVALVLGGALALVIVRPVNLGLDLRGGTQIVLEARVVDGREPDADTIERTLEVMRRRVDQLGVTEPNLARSGARRILVELPGVTDPDEALEVIGRTAQLTFHQVIGLLPPEASPPPDDEALILRDEDGRLLALDEPRVTGEAVVRADALFEPGPPGQWIVEVGFRGDGAREWERLTGEAACVPLEDPSRRIAIVLDEDVISSPQVAAGVECNRGIVGGTTAITGAFSEDEARNLALLIRAGALPVPVDVVEQRTIGPTLGEAAIAASTEAVVIGGALTLLFMMAYYRLLGGLAAVALVSYGVIAFGVLLALEATLTLPGIAGFVLAVGMAVDANILIYERFKEEHAGGITIRSAAQRGFSNAFSAIVDSNVTTLLAAALLFFFAAGPVRGFGVTLSVGVVVSMFSALVVTRVLLDLVMRTRLRNKPGVLGVQMGSGLRTRLAERSPNLVGRRRTWFALSMLAVVVAGAGLATRGLNFGLEFTGGRLVEYSTARTIDLNELRSELAAVGLPRAVVQESGNGNVAIRVSRLTREDEAGVEEAVRGLGGQLDKVRDELVGPTIGAELRRAAFIALGLALAAQLLYLAVRFRWTFGVSAVVAMFHDVLLVVGIFAWLGKDIDGVFLAALLTVIGYSVNDSVVIFDRVREERTRRRREPIEPVTNDACLYTLPRTINTGLSTLFILFALYLLGGDTLSDFALALILGIVVGTYSSIFTAAPLSVLLDRSSAGPQRRKRTRAFGGGRT